MPHVLFLSSYYPNRIHPFKGPFIRNHAHAIGIGNIVSVIDAEAYVGKKLFEIDSNQFGNVLETIVYYNIKYIKFPVIKNIFAFIAFVAGVSSAIKKSIRLNGKINIVHIHSTLPIGIFGLVYKFFFGKQYYVTEHGTNLIKENFIRQPFLKRFLIKLILRNAKGISAVTEYHAAEIIKCTQVKSVYIIPNVLAKHSKIRIKNLPKEEIQLCHVSTLAAVKGVPGIINAVKSLEVLHSQVHLHIVGGNNETIDSLKKLCSEIKIKNVTFYGWQDRDFIYNKMIESDLFILNSAYETFCVVVAEALSCGLPVISPNLPPVKEFMDNKCGLFFEDEKSLPEKINKAILSYGDFSPEYMKARIESLFSPEVILEQFNTFYSAQEKLPVVHKID